MAETDKDKIPTRGSTVESHPCAGNAQGWGTTHKNLTPVGNFHRQERLDHDLVRLHADGDDGQEGVFRRLQLRGLSFLNHRQVSGTGVEHEQIVLILRKRQRIRVCSHGKIGDDLAEVDVVNRNVIRSEVREVQAGVIKRNHAAGGLSADEIAARNFVVRGLDDGDAAGVEVEGNQFSRRPVSA